MVKIVVYVSIAVFSAFFLGTPPLAQAGDIDPPIGDIGPTGRFGPRTEISQTKTPGDENSLFKIAESGSYYLPGNITGESGKNGIEIAADNVTLDLNGFALIAVSGSLNGLFAPDAIKNLAIRNGTISQWKEWGIKALNSENSLFENLRIYLNGTNGSHDGLMSGPGSIVNSCATQGNTGHGIQVGRGSIVRYCSARGNGSRGIAAESGNTIIDLCTASDNGTDGIYLDGDSNMVTSCTASGNPGGIHLTGSDNRIEGNNVTNNDRGIDVDSTGNIIIRNTASGNTNDYDIAAGNTVGDILDFTAGGTVTSCNPWANFAY